MFKSRNISFLLVAVLGITAAAQCGRPTRGNRPTDACGGSGSHPVTLGGVMVIGCK